MTATEAQEAHVCDICSHDFDPHVMMTLDPMKGGVGRCPVKGCECHFTWAPNGGAPPDEETLAILAMAWENDREKFQVL